MLALAPGAAIAGLFEAGSVAQMAANVTVLPIAILVAVGMFREGGALEILIVNLGQFTSSIGLPVEALRRRPPL